MRVLGLQHVLENGSFAELVVQVVPSETQMVIGHQLLHSANERHHELREVLDIYPCYLLSYSLLLIDLVKVLLLFPDELNYVVHHYLLQKLVEVLQHISEGELPLHLKVVLHLIAIQLHAELVSEEQRFEPFVDPLDYRLSLFSQHLH